jgi:hypothetical protein
MIILGNKKAPDLSSEASNAGSVVTGYSSRGMMSVLPQRGHSGMSLELANFFWHSWQITLIRGVGID